MARLHPCPTSGCPTLTTGGPCPECRKDRQRKADADRPSSAARGYGQSHQMMRKWWAYRVGCGEVNCARCGLPIRPDEPWDLGHDDGDPNRQRGYLPEHAACNRATKGRA